MNDDTTKAMDEIMASIRNAVTTGEPALAIAAARDPEPVPAKAPAPSVLAEPAAAAAGTTLESLVAGLLEPMLKTWLDAHLPEIVEARVQAEIMRLTAR